MGNKDKRAKRSKQKAKAARIAKQSKISITESHVDDGWNQDIDVRELTRAEHSENFDIYRTLKPEARQLHLETLHKQHGLGFNPEEYLEFIVDSAIRQIKVEDTVEKLKSATLKWKDLALIIRSEIGEHEFSLMLPVIKFLEYDLPEVTNQQKNQMSNLGRIELQNPYLDASELECDIKLAAGSVKEFFGDVPDDFIPPLLSEDSTEHAMTLHPWNAVFKDKMVEKYGNLEAEPYFKFALSQFIEINRSGI